MQQQQQQLAMEQCPRMLEQHLFSEAGHHHHRFRNPPLQLRKIVVLPRRRRWSSPGRIGAKLPVVRATGGGGSSGIGSPSLAGGNSNSGSSSSGSGSSSSRLRTFALGRTKVDQAQAVALLEEFREACDTPPHRLRQVVDAVVADMRAGLQSEEPGSSCLKMLPAFVDKLPTGEEAGVFYALDLGGTNFRVLRARLGGRRGRVLKQEYKEESIPPALMTGTSDQLFDYIASKLAEFVATEGDEFLLPEEPRRRELGFTFSFPVKQTSIASGTLIHWSKGFKVSGSVGEDIVAVLRAAIARQGLDMRVAALVNDTVGTLAGGRYWNAQVMVAVILGTGTNACYVERADAVGKWSGPPPASGATMVINTEWGNFASAHLPVTYADRALDADTVNPGEHGFEKLISGLYLGDLLRRVMLRMATEAGLFVGGATGTGSVPDKLFHKFALTTPDMSKMHADTSRDLHLVGAVLRDVLGVHPTTLAERQMVVAVADVIARRGARLSAAGIVGILKKIGRDGHGAGAGVTNGAAAAAKTVVAMDGGLYENYAHFRDYLHEAVVDLLGEAAAQHVVIELSKDGSGVGAALLAACHSDSPSE